MSLKLTPILICLVIVQLILGQYIITKSRKFVLHGASITFSCNTGQNVDSVQWIAQGLKINVSQGSGTSCTGTPPPKYQYSCSGGTIFNLTINNIDFSYNGTAWRCGPIVGGTPSNTEYLKVYGLPIMTGFPNDVMNQKHTFQCKIPSSITSSVKFKKYSITVCTVLPNCTVVDVDLDYSCKCAGQIETSRFFNLTINKLHLRHEAEWYCEDFKISSNKIHLQIFTPVNSVYMNISGKKPNSFQITEGNSAVFTCIVQGAKPAPTVSQILWYVDSNKLPVRITGSPTTPDRLTTLNVTYTASRDHDGQKVFCAAKNDLMINKSIPAVSSSNKIELHIQEYISGSDSTFSSMIYAIITFINTLVITGLL